MSCKSWPRREQQLQVDSHVKITVFKKNSIKIFELKKLLSRATFSGLIFTIFMWSHKMMPGACQTENKHPGASFGSRLG